jgi:predicted PP-loop superfamily ATPase
MDIQKFQAETQMQREVEQIKADAKLQEIRANLELQAANDQRDSERETMKAMHMQELERMKLELEKYKTDQDNETRIIVAQIAAGSQQQVAAQRAEQAQMSDMSRMQQMQPPL